MAIGRCGRRPNSAVRDTANGPWVEGPLGEATRIKMEKAVGMGHDRWINEGDAAPGHMKAL